MKHEEVFVSKRDRWAGVMFWGIVLCTWVFSLLLVLDKMAWMDLLGAVGISLIIRIKGDVRAERALRICIDLMR